MPAEPPAGAEPDKDDGPVRALDADDIALLKTYGLGPYTASIKVREAERERERGAFDRRACAFFASVCAAFPLPRRRAARACVRERKRAGDGGHALACRALPLA